MACRFLYIFCILFTIAGSAVGTTIEVGPTIDCIQVNDHISIPIVCYPSEPVFAYECGVTYDPAVITVTGIDSGDFFQTYDTFASPNKTIDNTNGTIQQVYELILGPIGNITENGTLFFLNITASNTIGSTTIALKDCGVTNETRYLDLSVKQRTITVHNTTYPRWDITQDGKTDAIDISSAVSHYGEQSTDPENDLWDVIIDGMCDAQDISLIVSKYGNV
jgi:hypothetical protein